MDLPCEELRRICEIDQPTDHALVVISARQLLARMGFSRRHQFLIASAVSELATNIVRYAGTGIITMEAATDDGRSLFIVTATDQGPGIGDIEKALEDHYSTGKGLGLGLSSVRRIMDTFSIRSGPGQGTFISASKWLYGK